MKAKEFQNKIAMIAKFGYQIAHEKHLDKLIELLAEQVRILLHADRCSVFIMNKNKKELWSKVAHEINGRILHFPITQGVIGYVASTGRTANIVDAYNDPYFNMDSDRRTGYKTKTILAMPMKNAGGQILGVFQVLNKKQGIFSLEDEGLLHLLSSIAAAAVENAELYENIRKSEYETITRLAMVTQLRDRNDLAGHLKRMSEYSKLIAEAMGVPIERSEIIRFASLLHDIGKVGVPDNILLLRRKLNDEEFEEMKKHTIYGAKVLEHPENELLKVARDVALGHHENFDGSGYPYGLQGDDIPLEARIVSVADVFDALMSKRVYKEGWGLNKTLEFIKEQTGRKFDPKVVQALFKCLPKICEVLEKSSASQP